MVQGLIVIILALSALVGFLWALTHLFGLTASLLWTGLAAFVGWAIKSHVEGKRERHRLMAEQKRQQYMDFLEVMGRFIEATRSGEDISGNQEIVRQLSKLNLRLMLIGSDSVVNAWNAARNLNSGEPPLRVSSLCVYGDVFYLRCAKMRGTQTPNLKFPMFWGPL